MSGIALRLSLDGNADRQRESEREKPVGQGTQTVYMLLSHYKNHVILI